MDIKIQDKWLREYLDTNAKPEKIAECLSLCGPSVEKVDKTNNGIVYNIEITGNRMDCASVYGIAREAAAILPRFGYKAVLKSLPNSNLKLKKKVSFLNTIINHNLCPRFTAALIRDVNIGKSPKNYIEKIESSGARGINNIVDISNFVMYELGQPFHTFDYDKIKDSLMMLRESKKGEKVITLDGVERTLSGGDIVIEDGSGNLIDLCGIMGGKLSAVDENTKNVLLFVQSYNPVNIRRTSMSLAHRTDAAVLFEKGLDPENVIPAINRGIQLFEELTGGKAEKEVLDIYPSSYKKHEIKVKIDNIEKIIGIDISKNNFEEILISLGFTVKGNDKGYIIGIPSYRSKDIFNEEDIAEEIARIYGYHNIPSRLMDTEIPLEKRNPIFNFENNLKDILKGYGGNEIYSLSLVSKSDVTENAYKLANPLGKDAEYLRTSLMPSLLKAKAENTGYKESYFLFELSNIYLPRLNDLPKETEIVAGICVNTEYRHAKGIVESLLEELNVNYKFDRSESSKYAPGIHLEVISNDKVLGEFGVLNSNDFYFEFNVQKLFESSNLVGNYKPISKYPSQIEDLTVVLPEQSETGNIISAIKKVHEHIEFVDLKEIYKDAFTFRIEYLDRSKTLQNKDVDKIRKQIEDLLIKKYGAKTK